MGIIMTERQRHSYFYTLARVPEARLTIVRVALIVGVVVVAILLLVVAEVVVAAVVARSSSGRGRRGKRMSWTSWAGVLPVLVFVLQA